MIDETLNPSEEKSTARSSEENISKENEFVPEVTEVAVDEAQEELCGAIISEVELKNMSSRSLKEIVEMFRNLVDNGDIMELNRQAEYIKATFYKVLKEEKIASGYHLKPGESDFVGEEAGDTAGNEAVESDAAPEAEATVETETAAEPEIAGEETRESVSVNPFVEIERAFKELYARYKGRRAVYFQNLEKEKQNNLEKKTEIIEQIKELLDSTTEDFNKTFPEFRALQARWREIGPVPQARVKDIYETYQHYVEKVYDLKKLNNEFRDYDFKRNYEIKVSLCEKAEALSQSSNVVEAFAQLQKLHEEWKECGPVAKEFRDSIWERFRAATSVVNKMHQAHFEGIKVQQKENLAAKTLLCEQAEALADKEIKDSANWNSVSKEFENLQAQWRKIGFASKKDNQKIYDRFRAACDKFYERKREFYADLKGRISSNMEKKVALCEQAEAVMDSTDWKKTSEYLIDLQKQWREIGPVSRKKSDQIWARFRAACDHFFNNKEKNFGGVDSSYVENLQTKRNLIEEIKAYIAGADVEADLSAAKEFQKRWSSVGFVPFKEMEAITSAFKEAMAEKFPEFKVNLGQGRQGGRPGRQGRSRASESPERRERDRLMDKYRKLENEIATYENNIGFFANSKNAESLLAGLREKIDAAKAELAKLEAEIEKLY